MVVLNRIYTRTGDAGTTALGTGDRVPKTHPRIAAYGTVDELNAFLGLARLHTGDNPQLDAMLARIQNDLFDLGADLCVPQEKGKAEGGREALRIADRQVARLETEIDALNAALQPLRSFVLPGGTAAAAALHVARTVCRRAERAIAALSAQDGETVGGPAMRYINRLSDLLFVAARAANDQGRRDVLWTPGANR